MLTTTPCDGSAAIRFRFGGDAISVRRALQAVVSTLGSRNIGADHCGLAELVLAEVLNNVVEHAYAGRDDGEIELTLHIRPGEVDCSVIDSGLAMPGGALPGDEGPEPNDLPEGGFGWPLIHAICRRIDYRRQGTRNRLSFTLDTAPA